MIATFRNGEVSIYDASGAQAGRALVHVMSIPSADALQPNLPLVTTPLQQSQATQKAQPAAPIFPQVQWAFSVCHSYSRYFYIGLARLLDAMNHQGSYHVKCQITLDLS